MFSGQVALKRYVAFHLFPLYVSAELRTQVSPALAKRKQGKNCFDFTRVDAALFAELEALTTACANSFAAPFAPHGNGCERRPLEAVRRRRTTWPKPRA